MLNYELCLEAFNHFLEKYDQSNQQLRIKINHTFRVVDVSETLANKLGLSDEEKELAKIIGLLHDIGRFEQLIEYGVYDDCKTKFDHALSGINYLFQEGHIKDFNIHKKYHQIIYKAILNHNKLEISGCSNDQEIFFAKLIRDADKIDVYRQSASDFDLIYDGATEEVKESFRAYKLIDRTKIITNADEVLTEMAFIFDFNFQESFSILDETGNLPFYVDKVKINKNYINEFTEFKTQVLNYLKERV